MENSPYLDGEKSLIFAIIYQAYHDAQSFDWHDSPEAAMRFIKGATPCDRKLFAFYASLVGYDPEWLREKLSKRIDEIRAKKQAQIEKSIYVATARFTNFHSYKPKKRKGRKKK